MIRKLMISAALAALVGFVTPINAAPRGGDKPGGGGGGKGNKQGGNQGGYYGNPGFIPGHGNQQGYFPGYPGDFRGYPGYYSGYNPGYYQSGYGYGYGFPWGSIALGYGLGRGAGFGGYGVGSYSSPYYYSPPNFADAGSAPIVSPPPPAGPQSRITVLLPHDAKLWIGDYVSTLIGPERVLVTPPLDPSQTYSYTLLALWNEEGRPVSRTREVKFRAGESMTVDMTLPEPTPPPVPATPPVPTTPPVPRKIQ